MTETKQQSEKESKCYVSEMPACCVQMSKIMQQFCGTKKDGFDCMAMMQKMGRAQAEDKKPAE